MSPVMILKAGKGGRPENYKHVRWKLQSDRLNRGWKDQPAHGTNNGRGRSQLAQIDDLTLCVHTGPDDLNVDRRPPVVGTT